MSESQTTGTPSRAMIRDIARLADVSPATVSRVLNGRPDVASATREKILRAIQESGYVTRRFALPTKKMVACLLPRLVHFATIAEGASDALEEQQIHMLVCPTASQLEREADLIKQLSQEVEALLLVLPVSSPDTLLKLRREGYPFVVIDPRYPLSEEIPVITTANMTGAHSATEHLVRLGHRRIGVITGPRDWCATTERLAGFHSVLFRAGITNRPELVREGDFTTKTGFQAACELFALPEPPTAIFAFNDAMAIGVLQAAREHSIRIPDQLSLMGFNNDAFTEYSIPALTTVSQASYEMGRLGADMLRRLIEKQQLEFSRVELSTRLIARTSTGPAPQDK